MHQVARPTVGHPVGGCSRDATITSTEVVRCDYHVARRHYHSHHPIHGARRWSRPVTACLCVTFTASLRGTHSLRASSLHARARSGPARIHTRGRCRASKPPIIAPPHAIPSAPPHEGGRGGTTQPSADGIPRRFRAGSAVHSTGRMYALAAIRWEGATGGPEASEGPGPRSRPGGISSACEVLRNGCGVTASENRHKHALVSCRWPTAEDPRPLRPMHCRRPSAARHPVRPTPQDTSGGWGNDPGRRTAWGGTAAGRTVALACAGQNAVERSAMDLRNTFVTAFRGNPRSALSARCLGQPAKNLRKYSVRDGRLRGGHRADGEGVRRGGERKDYSGGAEHLEVGLRKHIYRFKI